MPKKTGLGKGLDALFGPVPEEEKAQENDVLKNLKITEVEPNREQPRKNFNQEALEELAESIKEYGLIQNIQREDLNPFEKAVGIKNLMITYGYTQEEVAQKLGKSRSAIANTVRTLNLEPRVLELVKEGKLSEGHCRALLAITDPEKQYLTAVDIIERGAPVNELEKTNKKINQKQVSREEIRRNAILYKDIENTFQGFFGTKVKLNPGKKKGKIVIEYSSNDDLERILNLMK